MIGKLKSKLSVKVFLFTMVLMVACCGATYLCVLHLSPYIYTWEPSDLEEMAEIYAMELSNCTRADAHWLFAGLQEDLKNFSEDEYIIRMFQSSGEELSLPGLKKPTGKMFSEYLLGDRTQEYTVTFADEDEAYLLILARNTDKESQIAVSIQRSLPLIGTVILLVSVTASFFFTWYITAPIKKVSKTARRMADLDFNRSGPGKRSDEIGILSDSLDTLAQRLSAALLELQEANERLQADIDLERQLKRQQVEFFSAASHELKTPITIIKGQLEGMLCQVGRYKDRDTYLARSLEVAGTLEQMVQNLLTIARFDMPGYGCEKQKLDLSGLVKERLTAYEDLFMQKDLTVESNLVPGLFVMGDWHLLCKAVDNLLGNAAAYSGAGNQIFVHLWKGSDQIHLIIENTGVQIPREDIPRLYEAFYRVDRSRNRQTGGSGLGLYIVKTILDLHGAEIEIANSSRGVMVESSWESFSQSGPP